MVHGDVSTPMGSQERWQESKELALLLFPGSMGRFLETQVRAGRVVMSLIEQSSDKIGDPLLAPYPSVYGEDAGRRNVSPSHLSFSPGRQKAPSLKLSIGAGLFTLGKGRCPTITDVPFSGAALRGSWKPFAGAGIGWNAWSVGRWSW